MKTASILETLPPGATMPTYDLLPAEVRAAIAGASFPYDPRIVSARISRGVRPARILAEIATFERRPQPWW